MRFVDSWASADQRVLLSFANDVLSTFDKYIQTEPRAPESGGLLLGSVHGNNLLIIEATAPTIFDRQFRYLFERMPFGHKAVAERRWRQSGGTVRYLGEWHTHPQDYPLPSQLDRDEWFTLAQKRTDARPLLAVIVGRKALHIELVSRVGDRTVFSPMLN
jgi:integrative and conjugative element protein (TIGR02256 family)